MQKIKKKLFCKGIIDFSNLLNHLKSHILYKDLSKLLINLLISAVKIDFIFYEFN